MFEGHEVVELQNLSSGNGNWRKSLIGFSPWVTTYFPKILKYMSYFEKMGDENGYKVTKCHEIECEKWNLGMKIGDENSSL